MSAQALLALSILLIIALAFAVNRFPRPPCAKCDLETVAKSRAPLGAIACGRARHDAARESVLKCALEHDARDEPY